VVILTRGWDKWIDSTWIDWVVAAALTFAVVFWRLWDFVRITEHGAFYQTLTGVALGFLSLGTVAVTLVVTVPQSQQLRQALRESGKNLIGLMFSCLNGLIVATLLFAVLFCLEIGGSGLGRAIVGTIGVTLMLLRASRLLWLLQRILSLLL
jgi:hypothetical protein